MEDSIIRRTAKKVQKHKKKVSVFSIATIVLGLQLVHALGPMVCSLPFIHDSEACMETVKRASEAAKVLDSMALDAGVLQ